MYVDGSETTWNLRYATYDELPVHNGDYGSCVRYQGKSYFLWRVYSDQIQVGTSHSFCSLPRLNCFENVP